MNLLLRGPARTQRWQIERLADLLFALSRALRSGHTLHRALVGVAADPTVAGPDFRRAVARMEGGSPVREEMDRWAATLADRDADLVRAVLNAGSTTGSALAASLDRAASSLRDRADLQREIAALTAQARASALLLTLAPVAFIGVLSVADPAVITTAIATTTGRVAFAVGVALDVVGWVWMRRLVEAVDP